MYFVVDEHISSAIGVLEAFGNCSTDLNRNASRFAQLLTLGFDATSALNSARIQTYFLDVDKLTSKTPSSSTFHIMYYLWEGADDQLRNYLGFNLLEPFFNPLTSSDDKIAAKQGFQRVLHVFTQLNFTDGQIQGIINVLGAIFHLIYANAQGSIAARSTFVKADNAQKAAELLGMSFEHLNLAVFRGQGTEMNNNYSVNKCTGQEALISFVQTLYNELFSALTNLINKFINKQTPFTTITLLDVPGSNFTRTSSTPSDLSDFLFNYLNERLSELFHKASFKNPQDLYQREQVDVAVERPRTSPQHLTRLVDRKQQLVSTLTSYIILYT